MIPTTGYKPGAMTREAEQGRRLFEDLNCAACHTIHNVGGDSAPTLDGVGGRRNESFLVAHLSNAAQAVENYKAIRGADFANALPHSRYSPESARLLVAYLDTLPEPAGGFVLMPHTPRLPAEPQGAINKDFHPSPKNARSVEGELSYNKFGCVACHAIGDIGGWFGPRLDGVGARRDREYINAHITDAQAHARRTAGGSEEGLSKMPRFTISADEARKITDYLMTLPRL